MVQKAELEEEDDLKNESKAFDFNITITLINVLGFNFPYGCKLLSVLMSGISICTDIGERINVISKIMSFSFLFLFLWLCCPNPNS